MSSASKVFWDRCAGITDRFEKVTARRFEELSSFRSRQKLLDGRKTAAKQFNIVEYQKFLHAACEAMK